MKMIFVDETLLFCHGRLSTEDTTYIAAQCFLSILISCIKLCSFERLATSCLGSGLGYSLIRRFFEIYYSLRS
jgi:hypothetical protein